MVIPDVPIALNAALEGLVQVNVILLLSAIRIGNPIPRLYSLGIRYKVEPPPREWWQTIADNLHERHQQSAGTDCEDLAGTEPEDGRAPHVYIVCALQRLVP